MPKTCENVEFVVLGTSQYPPKGGGFSYKCRVGSTECYLDTAQSLTPGTWHAERIEDLARRGKGNTIYGKLAGAITQAGQAPAPNRPVAAPAVGHSLLAYEKLADRIGRFVLQTEQAPWEFKTGAFRVMFSVMSIDPGVMAEMEAQAKAPANPSTEPETGGGVPDTLPPDEEIPF